jgi:uncharacterized membrane protein
VSSYGFAIVLICLVGGWTLSLAVSFLITDPPWRRVAFFTGIAVASVYVLIQPTGYDRWDAYVAAWYSGGAVAGWLVGFGINAHHRTRQRMTSLPRHD